MSSSPSPVTREAASSAVRALTKWMHARNASKPSLLPDDRADVLTLQLSLRLAPGTDRANPFLLPLSHPLFSLSEGKKYQPPSICFVTYDRSPDSPSPSVFLEKAKEVGLTVGKSIGVSTLRSEYGDGKMRKKLCQDYDIFLADKRVLPVLQKFLGKAFFGKKKNMLPINFSRPGWPEQVKRVLNSAFFYLKSGSVSGIRVGRLCMEVGEIMDNVMRVIEDAVDKVPGKWENVRSLHLKAVGLEAVPIYQDETEMGLEIEVGERDESEAGEVLDGDDEGGDGVEGKNEKASEKKGKKNKGLIGEELEKEKKEKRKKQAKDGEDEKKVKKKNEENAGEDVKAKGEKKGKKDKLEGQNVKEDKEKLKKKRSEGELVEATEKKGKKTKIRV